MINVIEYENENYYLTVGKNAPWDNFHIRVPKFIAKLFMKKVKELNQPRGEKK